jgi:hypothetical protein
MSTSHQATPGGGTGYGDTVGRRTAYVSPWVVGLALFAGTLMIVTGIFQAIAGVIALFRNEIYLVGVKNPFAFDVTTWGWVHLIVGILVALAGAAVLTGQLWGRVVGIGLAVASMIANFLFIPHYPIWSLLIIGLGVFVIWALCSYDREAAARR